MTHTAAIMRNAAIIKYLPRPGFCVSPEDGSLSSAKEVLSAPDDGALSGEAASEASASGSDTVTAADSVTVPAGCVSGAVVSDTEVSGGLVAGEVVSGGFVA